MPPLSRIFRPAAPPPVDWLSPLIFVSRGLAAVANTVPFPYVGAAFGAGVALLELIQTVGKTSEDLKYLAESVVTIMRLLKEEMESHHGTEDPRFRQVCLEFEAHLTRLSKDLEAMSKNWSSSKFRKYLNSQNVRDRIAQLTRQIDDLRANATLIAALGTRMDVADAFATVESKISELHREVKPSTVSTVSTQTLELARYEEDFHALKLGDIKLQFHTARSASFITYNHQGREERCTAWTDYRATVKGFVHTVRVYEGSDPTESWKGFLSFLADNSPSPHLPQLFGFCSSPRLRSLLVAICRLWTSRQYFPLNYALVNPEDQGTMVISHIGSKSFIPHTLIVLQYPPFLSWLTNANPTRPPVVTDAKFGTRIGDLLSLIPLNREQYFAIPLRSLWATLTARGSVYDRFTQETVAQMFTRAAVPADMWLEVRMRSFRTFDDLIEPRWPTRFDQTRRGFTHFALPLLDNKDRWCSLYDYTIQRGYFLSAEIEFGSAVPHIAGAWLAQAISVMSHPNLHGFKPADCFVREKSHPNHAPSDLGDGAASRHNSRLHSTTHSH
ncbi:hypothetical protein C8R46DRAFT_1095884 [Mycena filopes]|nr:hypothetical protein C8R46DRAFT_1095884 [Mycena filopes]